MNFYIMSTTRSSGVSSLIVPGLGVMIRADVAAVFAGKVDRDLVRATRQSEPIGRAFVAYQSQPDGRKVALQDNANKPASYINNKQAADMMRQHRVDGIGDRNVKADLDNLPRHDLIGASSKLSASERLQVGPPSGWVLVTINGLIPIRRANRPLRSVGANRSITSGYAYQWDIKVGTVMACSISRVTPPRMPSRSRECR